MAATVLRHGSLTIATLLTRPEFRFSCVVIFCIAIAADILHAIPDVLILVLAFSFACSSIICDYIPIPDDNGWYTLSVNFVKNFALPLNLLAGLWWWERRAVDSGEAIQSR